MPQVILASKTLAAIDAAVEADQGAAYRVWLGKVIGHIGDAYRGADDGFRSHLGGSLIGRECSRDIWMGFRWVVKPQFSGRILRLFNRGHLEEARFIALLLTIGCQVYQQDAEGKQFRITHAEGHMGGSGDGVVINCPDVPEGQPALCEFKTHSSKSFAELKAKGVYEAKFEHYVQMNVYMRKMGLALALYMAVNKDTDELHAEIIVLDPILADKFLDRGTGLIYTETPPDRISNTPGFFKCKFCDKAQACHHGKGIAKNCRTCMYSKPVANKEWVCTFHDKVIPYDVQIKGCDDYQILPGLTKA